MKILIDIGHPAHVHLFKNTIWNLEKNGHEIKITARDKEVTLALLDAYDFEYVNRGKGYVNAAGKLAGLIKTNYSLLKISNEFKPDVLIGMHNPYISQVAKIIRKPSIIFTDTEHAKLANYLTFPFADVICTPSCFKKDLGKKQIRYNSYHELAYLHPKYFTPNPAVLDEAGLDKDDVYIILRFVSWNASHDISQRGIRNKIKLVKKLEKYGQVIITSEGILPKSLEKYQIKVSPEQLHDLLYYATLYVGEGATMASECAVLGTHAIYINTLRLGYTDEEEEKYSIVFNFSNRDEMEEQAFSKALELIENDNLKNEGRIKRQLLLKDKIDLTEYLSTLIEKYQEI